jgi:hypothetical protein
LIVDLGRIELPSAECKSAVLPLNYRPSKNIIPEPQTISSTLTRPSTLALINLRSRIPKLIRRKEKAMAILRLKRGETLNYSQELHGAFDTAADHLEDGGNAVIELGDGRSLSLTLVSKQQTVADASRVEGGNADQCCTVT